MSDLTLIEKVAQAIDREEGYLERATAAISVVKEADMTRCNITVTTRMVSNKPAYRSMWEELPQETVARCVTHGFDMDARPGVGIATLCPIGKIEEATEEALRKISEAAERASRVAPPAQSEEWAREEDEMHRRVNADTHAVPGRSRRLPTPTHGSAKACTCWHGQGVNPKCPMHGSENG